MTAAKLFPLHSLWQMLWMWCKNDANCFRSWLIYRIGMIKDVDTGTNLVCEDSRLNIRNGTPSQLIFHSHESDNREIETKIPVDKNRIMKPVFFKFTVRLCGHMMILRSWHVCGYIQQSSDHLEAESESELLSGQFRQFKFSCSDKKSLWKLVSVWRMLKSATICHIWTQRK